MTDNQTSGKNLISNERLVVLGFICVGLVLAFLPEGCGRSSVEKATLKNVTAIETTEQFDAKILGEEGLKVVDFYAVWCGPCKILAPILDDLAGEYKGKVAFYKLDAEKLRDLSARYQVRAYPTVIMFDASGQLEKVEGLRSRSVYKDKIQQYITAHTRPAGK